MFSDVISKVRGNNSISQDSAVIIKCGNIFIEDLLLDGALIVDSIDGIEVNSIIHQTNANLSMGGAGTTSNRILSLGGAAHETHKPNPHFTRVATPDTAQPKKLNKEQRCVCWSADNDDTHD